VAVGGVAGEPQWASFAYVRAVHRVLDIDLDFFVTPPVHLPPDWERPPAGGHDVWPEDEALAFLRDRCQVSDRLPGFVTENHAQLFPRWREAIAAGVLESPFSVTHLDAHADLGLGDNGYTYLMTSLLYEPVAERQFPAEGMSGLNEGNFLLFAIACRWVADLTYVFGDGGGGDELPYAFEGFHRPADRLQLAAMPKRELDKLLHRLGDPVADLIEPAVPYQSTRWESFQAAEPFDFICLTRSPLYTPTTADPLYDLIRSTFVDPITGR